jgi:hypothetical protein
LSEADSLFYVAYDGTDSGTTNEFNAFIIDGPNKRVGIETTPNEKLDVNGNVKIRGQYVKYGTHIESYTVTNRDGLIFWDPSDNNTKNASRFHIDFSTSGASVGIGKAPDTNYALDVNGTIRTNNGIRYNYSSIDDLQPLLYFNTGLEAGSHISMSGQHQNYLHYYSGNTSSSYDRGAHIFYTSIPSGTNDEWKERFRIDTNGNVGIGTTNPEDTLHVNGGAYIGNHGIVVKHNKYTSYTPVNSASFDLRYTESFLDTTIAQTAITTSTPILYISSNTSGNNSYNDASASFSVSYGGTNNLVRIGAEEVSVEGYMSIKVYHLQSGMLFSNMNLVFTGDLSISGIKILNFDGTTTTIDPLPSNGNVSHNKLALSFIIYIYVSASGDGNSDYISLSTDSTFEFVSSNVGILTQPDTNYALDVNGIASITGDLNVKSNIGLLTSSASDGTYQTPSVSTVTANKDDFVIQGGSASNASDFLRFNGIPFFDSGSNGNYFRLRTTGNYYGIVAYKNTDPHSLSTTDITSGLIANIGVTDKSISLVPDYIAQAKKVSIIKDDSEGNCKMRINSTLTTTPDAELNVEGDIYASGTISPFTGSHVSKNENVYDERYYGFVVRSTGIHTANIEIDNTRPMVEFTESSYCKSVIGVYSKKQNREGNIHYNAVGEGAIMVCNFNGAIENGDYLTSSPIKGLCMKQNDIYLANFTVAKSTMTCIFSPIQTYKRLPVMVQKTDASGNLMYEIDETKSMEEDKTVYDLNKPIMTHQIINGKYQFKQSQSTMDVKYLHIYTDRYIIYNDEDLSDIYLEVEQNFLEKQDIIGNTYKVCLISATYHCG